MYREYRVSMTGNEGWYEVCVVYREYRVCMTGSERWYDRFVLCTGSTESV